MGVWLGYGDIKKIRLMIPGCDRSADIFIFEMFCGCCYLFFTGVAWLDRGVMVASMVCAP